MEQTIASRAVFLACLSKCKGRWTNDIPHSPGLSRSTPAPVQASADGDLIGHHASAAIWHAERLARLGHLHYRWYLLEAVQLVLTAEAEPCEYAKGVCASRSWTVISHVRDGSLRHILCLLCVCFFSSFLSPLQTASVPCSQSNGSPVVTTFIQAGHISASLH